MSYAIAGGLDLRYLQLESYPRKRKPLRLSQPFIMPRIVNLAALAFSLVSSLTTILLFIGNLLKVILYSSIASAQTVYSEALSNGSLTTLLSVSAVGLAIAVIASRVGGLNWKISRRNRFPDFPRNAGPSYFRAI